MKAWLRHHAQSLAGTISRLVRQPLASLLNVAAIGIALALPFGAYVVTDNLLRLMPHLSRNPQMTVFLATDATRTDANRIAAQLTQASAVRGVRFVPKEAALAEMRRAEGVVEIVAALKSNPLPDAFVVDLAPGAGSAAEDLVSHLRALPKVAQVQLDAQWLRRLDALLTLGRSGVAILSALLAMGLVAVIFNTVRLQIVTQADEIEVCRLIGATNGYIRRPFFYQGALLGAIGGGAAIAIVAASLWLLNLDVAALAQTYASSFRLTLPGAADLAAVVAFAAMVGWLGAYLSVSRYLGRRDGNL